MQNEINQNQESDNQTLIYYKCQSPDRVNTYEYKACSELSTRKLAFRFYWYTEDNGYCLVKAGVNNDLGNIDGIAQKEFDNNILIHAITGTYPN